MQVGFPWQEILFDRMYFQCWFFCKDVSLELIEVEVYCRNLLTTSITVHNISACAQFTPLLPSNRTPCRKSCYVRWSGLAFARMQNQQQLFGMTLSSHEGLWINTWSYQHVPKGVVLKVGVSTPLGGGCKSTWGGHKTFAANIFNLIFSPNFLLPEASTEGKGSGGDGRKKGSNLFSTKRFFFKKKPASLTLY